MLNTQNSSQGWFELQVKLSLLILPLALLPVASISKNQQKFLYDFFILGCLVAVIICLSRAYIDYNFEQKRLAEHNYTLNNGINLFLSSRLSYFIHPSYFSMYLSFAISILLFTKSYFLQKWYFKWSIISLFVFVIVLLASKAGIIVLAIIILIYLIRLRNLKLTILMLSLFILSFFILYNVAPEFANKFINFSSALNGNEVDEKTFESSSARVLAWESSLQIIKTNFGLGCGTGDVQISLLQQYKANGYIGLEEKNLNAHNQFLQTTLAIGVLGLISLLFIFIHGIRFFIKQKAIVGLILIMILFSNFIVEAMLETQAGVVFFAFWLLVESYKSECADA